MKYNLGDIVFHKEYNQIYKIINQYNGQIDAYYRVKYVKSIYKENLEFKILTLPRSSFESKTRLLTTEEKIELL